MANGDFVLPYTASIWDAAHFWTINLDACAWYAGGVTYVAGIGYSFEQVKIVDLAWDVLLGRGGQALLGWMAYRLFRQVIAVLMERGEVGYDVFASLAFNSGSLSSLLMLLRHAVGWSPLPQSKRALGAYAAMAVATSYIIAMPTLLSAMTDYQRYASIYAQCPSTLNISTCIAANVSTYVNLRVGESEDMALLPPMPGIITWPDKAPRYTHWDCSGVLVETAWFESEYAEGWCRAGAGYVWGFSFLLTLVVSILTMVFAMIMFGLWLHVRPRGGSDTGHAADHGVFKDAVTMVTQAQSQYGGKVGEWSARTLQKEVVKGKQGMSFASGATTAAQRAPGRRRKTSDDEFGDPLVGDWGVDVIIK
ncbi:hypothetical protein LTR85_001075 [Meristemomyces frigidus]|nr:hypothetical protein LTR85_001075 [Meristemomyces frigidus]